MEEHDDWQHLNNRTYLAELKFRAAFPEYVKQLRLRLELTQKQMAGAVGCDASYISNIETGQHNPGPTAPIVSKILALE